MEGAFLEVLRKNGTERVELSGAQVTLGRASENTICFTEDDTVSRRHAVLSRAGDTWSIRDTGSSNGTFVNGDRLTAERLLQPGDQVKLGDTRLVYRRSAAATPPVERAPMQPFARGQEQPPREISGIARGIQRRRGPSGDDEIVFQVDRYDGAGNPLPAVPVHLSSYHGGQVSDGEEVDITGEWMNGTLRAKTLFNVSTGADISTGTRWEHKALAGLAILFLLLLVLIYLLTLG